MWLDLLLIYNLEWKVTKKIHLPNQSDFASEVFLGIILDNHSEIRGVFRLTSDVFVCLVYWFTRYI